MTRQVKTTKQPHDDGISGRQVWRIESLAEADVTAADEGHSWAVSYSDLLMVLMSFFIIFFSYQEEKPQDLLRDIAVGISSKAKKSQPQQNGVPSQPSDGTSGAITQSNLSQALSDVMTKNKVAIAYEVTPTMVKVTFEEELFAKRKWQLSKEAQIKLDTVLSVLLPNKDDIIVEIVGYTDVAPVTKVPGDIISDNFILSSLRSATTMNYLVTMGFNPQQIRSVGAGVSSELGRTLSLQFYLKDQVGKKAD